MMNEIAAIIGMSRTATDPVVVQILARVASKLPAGITPESASFEKEVLKAEKIINDEGNMSMISVMKALLAEPPAKVYKIKQSQKGARIKVAAANGIRYSFGPIWNESVIKGKGVALNEQNREKLNHQGLMFGLKTPEKMKLETLVSKIAEKLQTAA